MKYGEVNAYVFRGIRQQFVEVCQRVNICQLCFIRIHSESKIKK